MASIDTAHTDEVEHVRAEFRAWLEANWNPDITLGEWWERLGFSGWAFPTWPASAYGKGLDGEAARIVVAERSRVGAPGPPSGIGPMMAGPTIAEYGTPDQVARFLPGLVSGKHVWCQLFSEPGAGSDLASLQTRAVRDGEEWIINGQKVWTSGAQHSRWGILIARSNPEVPKHEGITYFVIDMKQPGVEVRPLREMTGGATFNEVFLNEARVPDADRIGDVDRGWSVAVTTLSHERKNLGIGTGGGFGGVGGVGGGSPMLGISMGDGSASSAPDLDQRASDTGSGGGGMSGMTGVAATGDLFRMLPAMFSRQDDPTVRQDIARLYTLMEISRYTALRSKVKAKRGEAPGPEQSVGKLFVSGMMRRTRDFLLGLMGPSGTLAGGNAPMGGMFTWIALFTPAISIAGGTDEIQRNIIGERVLGLPPEPRLDKQLPFRDLPVGTQR